MPNNISEIDGSLHEFNPFEGPEISDTIYTTESQLEIWLSCKLGGNDANRAFNESLSIRFEGEFDRLAFEKALNAVVNRHQSLRAAFTKDGSRMIIFKDLPLNYSFEDLSLGNYNPVQKENIYKKYSKNEVLHIFDLLYGPLFKFSLLKLSEKEYYFMFTAHHIICDGWSLGLIIQDLSKFYSGYVQGIPAELPEADLFSTYAREDIKYNKSSDYIKNENFWLNQFKNNIPVLDLPTDYPRPVPRTYKSARLDLHLDEELTTSLKNIGIKEGCSFVNTILAAFELFLHSVTGQEDIIIGMPAAGQLVSGQFELVGHCVNLMPIRSYPNPNHDFSKYLKIRKLAILDAYEHQRLTFSSLLKKIRTSRDPSRIPLVPVVFNIDMQVSNETYFHGLSYELFSNPREFENFELFLNLWGAKSHFQMEWSYNTQLFKKETIERMMQDFESLLKTIVANPLLTIENIIKVQPEKRKVELSHKLPELQLTDIIENGYENHWLNQLYKDCPVQTFPIDKSRPLINEYKGWSVTNRIDKERYNKFKTMLKSYNSGLYSGLVAIVNVLIYKYTDLTDIVIGGQLQEYDTITGLKDFHFFPLRCKFDKENSFLEIVHEIGKVVSPPNGYDDSSIEYIINEELQEKNLNENPLYNIMVLFQKTEVDLKRNHNEKDLSFVFSHVEDDLSLKIEFNRNLYNETTIQRVVGHINALLNSVSEQPNLKIYKIDYLCETEKSQLLYGFNQTEIPYPGNSSIIDLFELQVKETPDRIALVFEEKEYTYKELNEISNQFADFLCEKNYIKTDEVIGIKIERNDWLIITVLGVLKSGAAYLPLDMEYPEERILYMLRDSKCDIVIDKGDLTEFKAEKSKYSTGDLKKNIKSSDLAYIMYTSGSTGQPKGVMVEHRNVVRLVKSANYIDLNGNEVLLSTGAFSFDATTFEFWGMLLNGGKLVLCDQKVLLDIKLLAREMSDRNVTVMWFTSGWLSFLIDADISIFRNLKYLLAGGDKLSPAHIKKLRANYPELIIINGYGPTENTTFSMTYRINEVSDNIPIGKPISNSRAYIFNNMNQIVPIGVEGEIHLGGDGLSRGYMNNEDLTLKKFIINPYKEGDRLYKSGDIGKWTEDGNIEFIGRKDHQVKIRGYRIELGEIENVIQQFPLVEKSIVIASQESNQNKILIAYIESRSDIKISELQTFLSKKLPAYMVPGQYIILDKIPLTENGKIDRNKLSASHRISIGNQIVEDLTENEKIVADIWCELLNINKISKYDDFFKIGGHSLIAIQFIFRLENELNIKLPMSSLFEYPTIEKISKLLFSDTQKKKWKSLVPIKPIGSKVPLYLIHGGGLGVLIFNNIVIYLDSDQPVYGLQALGIEEMDEPLETIEEMASFYISEILQQNPNGPYHIAGLSAGGLIAFEMAQQLKAMGKEVKSLSVFDFHLVETEKQKTHIQKFLNFFPDFFPALIFNVKSICIYPKKTIKYYIMCWKLRYISMIKRLGFKMEEESNAIMSRINDAVSKNNAAMKNYKLVPYDGVIDLFISKEKVYYQKDPVYMGWKPFGLKGINIHEVKGDHDDMILQPNNKFFAKVLQDLLDKRI